MRTITRLTGAAAVALALTACGGGGDGDDDAIASLGGETTTTAADDDRGGGGGRPVDDSEFQDAMLEYAECMRDAGVDFADPQFGENGGVAIVGPGGPGEEPPSEAEMEEFEAADAECQHILEEVESSLPEPSPEQQQEMQDRALAFAECMREHGIDMPDPTFGEGGRIEQRFEADQGFDPSSDEFQEAQDACMEEGGGGPMIGAAPRAGTDESVDP